MKKIFLLSFILLLLAEFSPLYAALTITTSSCPGGTLNTVYTCGLSATGGQTPYSWTLAGGSLPSGLSVRSLDSKWSELQLERHCHRKGH